MLNGVGYTFKIFIEYFIVGIDIVGPEQQF